MSETYSKLFSSILTSSIWSESQSVKLVWITMLALKDRHGYVGASVSGLARMAGVTVEEAQAAVDKFLAPDKDSRSQEFEGRRITIADRGWQILNHDRFRDMRDEDARKSYERDRKRQQRARKKAVPDNPGLSAHAEADAHAEAEGTAPFEPSGPSVRTSTSLSSGPSEEQQRDQNQREVASPGLGPAGPEGQRDQTAAAVPASPAPADRGELFKVLFDSPYRANSKTRTIAILEAAGRLHKLGWSPRDLRDLAGRCKRNGRQPEALFAHLVDHPDEASKELAKR